jgi:toxin ParE1/3/4
MKYVVRKSPRARQELIEIFRYYAREAGLKTARRFFAAADATFERLASQPGLGTRYAPEEPALADLRCFPISRFKKYLVFYRAAAERIEIVHVLHGARDIPSILADDLGFEGDSEDESSENEEES